MAGFLPTGVNAGYFIFLVANDTLELHFSVKWPAPHINPHILQRKGFSSTEMDKLEVYHSEQYWF